MCGSEMSILGPGFIRLYMPTCTSLCFSVANIFILICFYTELVVLKVRSFVHSHSQEVSRMFIFIK